jgi:hypothetical protein
MFANFLSEKCVLDKYNLFSYFDARKVRKEIKVAQSSLRTTPTHTSQSMVRIRCS